MESDLVAYYPNCFSIGFGTMRGILDTIDKYSYQILYYDELISDTHGSIFKFIVDIHNYILIDQKLCRS